MVTCMVSHQQNQSADKVQQTSDTFSTQTWEMMSHPTELHSSPSLKLLTLRLSTLQLNVMESLPVVKPLLRISNMNTQTFTDQTVL